MNEKDEKSAAIAMFERCYQAKPITSPDEALDIIERVYLTPLAAVVRAEVRRLQARVAELTDERDELVQMGALDGRELTKEVAALRHDITRHVQIAAEQAQELEELRGLLNHISECVDKRDSVLGAIIRAALAGEKK